MTHEELEQALASISFGPPISLLKPRLLCERDGAFSVIKLGIDFPDRDHPEDHDVSVWRVLKTSRLARTQPHMVVAYLRTWMIDILTHEIDESLLVNGAREFDPHAGEPSRCPICGCKPNRIPALQDWGCSNDRCHNGGQPSQAWRDTSCPSCEINPESGLYECLT